MPSVKCEIELVNDVCQADQLYFVGVPVLLRFEERVCCVVIAAVYRAITVPEGPIWSPQNGNRHWVLALRRV